MTSRTSWTGPWSSERHPAVWCGRTDPPLPCRRGPRVRARILGPLRISAPGVRRPTDSVSSFMDQPTSCAFRSGPVLPCWRRCSTTTLWRWSFAGGSTSGATVRRSPWWTSDATPSLGSTRPLHPIGPYGYNCLDIEMLRYPHQQALRQHGLGRLRPHALGRLPRARRGTSVDMSGRRPIRRVPPRRELDSGCHRGCSLAALHPRQDLVETPPFNLWSSYKPRCGRPGQRVS